MFTYAVKKEKGNENATSEDGNKTRTNIDLKLHKLEMETRDGILTLQNIFYSLYKKKNLLLQLISLLDVSAIN